MSVYTTKNFNINQIILSEPVTEHFEKNKKKINYYRTKIWSEKEGNRFHIQAPKMFCFGVQPILVDDNKDLTAGYECSFVLIKKPNENLVTDNEKQPSWKQMGATDEEETFLNILDTLHTTAAAHLFKHKEKCGLFAVKNEELMRDKLTTPWRFQKKKAMSGIPDYTKSPILKVKLLFSTAKQNSQMITRFFNPVGEKLEVLQYLKIRFNATPAFLFDSIYIGNPYITFQIKLPEAVIFTSDFFNSDKRLIQNPENLINNPILEEPDNHNQDNSEVKTNSSPFNSPHKSTDTTSKEKRKIFSPQIDSLLQS